MKEDRSWVAPVAFLTFGVVLISAIFTFLAGEELISGERGTALVSWLTLVLTGCAFLAALTALFIAINQMKDGRAQFEIAKRNELTERLEIIDSFFRNQERISTCLYKIKEIVQKPRFIMHFPGEREADFNREFLEKMVSLEDELRKSLDKDIYSDIYQDRKMFSRLYNAISTPISWYAGQVETGGLSVTPDDMQIIIVKAINDYWSVLRNVKGYSDPRRIHIKLQLDAIVPRGGHNS